MSWYFSLFLYFASASFRLLFVPSSIRLLLWLRLIAAFLGVNLLGLIGLPFLFNPAKLCCRRNSAFLFARSFVLFAKAPFCLFKRLATLPKSPPLNLSTKGDKANGTTCTTIPSITVFKFVAF